MDDGDIDVRRALRLYAGAGFAGVVVPDHVPSMACEAPWHAGMAFTLGYLCALLEEL